MLEVSFFPLSDRMALPIRCSSSLKCQEKCCLSSKYPLQFSYDLLYVRICFVRYFIKNLCKMGSFIGCYVDDFPALFTYFSRKTEKSHLSHNFKTQTHITILMKCNECHSEIIAKNPSVCPYCGSTNLDVTEEKLNQCRKCGTLNKGVSKFCVQCGQGLNQQLKMMYRLKMKNKQKLIIQRSPGKRKRFLHYFSLVLLCQL